MYSLSDGARPSRGGGSPIQSTMTRVMPPSRKKAISLLLSLFQPVAVEQSNILHICGTLAEMHGISNMT
jgi:hypothetical protein